MPSIERGFARGTESSVTGSVIDLPHMASPALSELLAAAAAPPLTHELSWEQGARTVFRSEVARWPKKVRRRGRTAGVAIAVAATMFAGTTGLAAATGFPRPAARIVDHIFDSPTTMTLTARPASATRPPAGQDSHPATRATKRPTVVPPVHSGAQPVCAPRAGATLGSPTRAARGVTCGIPPVSVPPPTGPERQVRTRGASGGQGTAAPPLAADSSSATGIPAEITATPSPATAPPITTTPAPLSTGTGGGHPGTTTARGGSRAAGKAVGGKRTGPKKSGTAGGAGQGTGRSRGGNQGSGTGSGRGGRHRPGSRAGAGSGRPDGTGASSSTRQVRAGQRGATGRVGAEGAARSGPRWHGVTVRRRVRGGRPSSRPGTESA